METHIEHQRSRRYVCPSQRLCRFLQVRKGLGSIISICPRFALPRQHLLGLFDGRIEDAHHSQPFSKLPVRSAAAGSSLRRRAYCSSRREWFQGPAFPPKFTIPAPRNNTLNVDMSLRCQTYRGALCPVIHNLLTMLRRSEGRTRYHMAVGPGLVQHRSGGYVTRCADTGWGNSHRIICSRSPLSLTTYVVGYVAHNIAHRSVHSEPA